MNAFKLISEEVSKGVDSSPEAITVVEKMKQLARGMEIDFSVSS